MEYNLFQQENGKIRMVWNQFFELWVYQTNPCQGGKLDLSHEYLLFSKIGEKTQFNKKVLQKVLILEVWGL